MFLGLMRWCLMILQLQHSFPFLAFCCFFFFLSLYTFYISFLLPLGCSFDYGVFY